MNEKDKGIPDTESFKEFWEGHSFDDSCPLTKGKFFSSKKQAIGCLLIIPAIVDVCVDTWSELSRPYRQEKEAYDKLRAFLAIKKGGPIKSLTKGETFNIDKYPRGTIIHFSRDSQGLDYFHSDQQYWGILVQTKINGKYEDSIYYFIARYLAMTNSSPSIPFIPPCASLRKDDITVGKVTHPKWVYPPVPSSIENTLYRCNSLDVWKFGQEVRERQTIPQRVLGRLKPVVIEQTPNGS